MRFTSLKIALAATVAIASASVSSAAVQLSTSLNGGATITVPPSASFGAMVNFTADSTATALWTFTLGAAQSVEAAIFSTDEISDVNFSFTRLAISAGAAGAYNSAGPFVASSTTVLPNLSNGSSIGMSGVSLAAGTYTLSVLGNATGPSSIGGTISFRAPAVPEAATWAMMLVGFGGIGAALRSGRRSRTVTFA